MSFFCHILDKICQDMIYLSVTFGSFFGYILLLIYF